MAKEYLFNQLLPFLALWNSFYWLFGDSEKVKITLVIGWTVIIIFLMVGVINK